MATEIFTRAFGQVLGVSGDRLAMLAAAAAALVAKAVAWDASRDTGTSAAVRPAA